MTDEVIEAIQALRSALAATGHQVVLVGAHARNLTIDRPLGHEPRRTRDVDFAVRVADWTEYGVVATALVEIAGFQRRQTDTIKFLHPNGTELDIIPYGGIVDQDAMLRWPDDPQREMSMAGFAAIDAHVIDERVGDDILRVPHPSVLVALKIFAYADRSTQTLKDLEDLCTILQHATDLFHDRAFKELGDAVADYDYPDYGPLLIGRDIRARFDEHTLTMLLTIVRTKILRAPDYSDLYRARSRQVEPEEAIRHFGTLITGMTESL